MMKNSPRLQERNLNSDALRLMETLENNLVLVYKIGKTLQHGSLMFVKQRWKYLIFKLY